MPHSVEELRRVVQARDAEVALLKLMVRKLKLQLERRNRSLFGASSERFEGGQGSLIEATLLDETAAPKPAAKQLSPVANIEIDRRLPAHLPREQRLHRPDTTAAHHDNDGQACGCSACGGRLRRIGADVSEQLEYVPSHFKVIGYSLVRWTALTRYVDDGRIEIDNSAAERALRGVAFGRNNYLFMGSDAGGERAAAMYSLVHTAQLNGLDPQAYLREVFARIADHPINRIEELLPWNISAKPEVHKLAA